MALGGAAALGLLAFIAAPYLMGPCSRLVSRLCDSTSAGACEGLRRVIGPQTAERCELGLQRLAEAEQLPELARNNAISAVTNQMLGFPDTLLSDLARAHVVTEGALIALERAGRLDATSRTRVVQGPRATCVLIIDRMNAGATASRSTLHEMLVEMNHGEDLGPDGPDWLSWCIDRVQPR
jgi:hypothetical protein